MGAPKAANDAAKIAVSRQLRTHRTNQIPIDDLLICAVQDQQITGLYDLHRLQIMLPGKGRVRAGCSERSSTFVFTGLDMYYADQIQDLDGLDRDLSDVGNIVGQVWAGKNDNTMIPLTRRNHIPSPALPPGGRICSKASYHVSYCWSPCFFLCLLRGATVCRHEDVEKPQPRPYALQ